MKGIVTIGKLGNVKRAWEILKLYRLDNVTKNLEFLKGYIFGKYGVVIKA